MYLWNDLCLPTVSVHKSHTNCVQGPYCKLDRVFPPFSIWPKRKVCRPSIGGAKQGSVTYSTDWEDEVSQIFIVSDGLRLERFLFFYIYMKQLTNWWWTSKAGWVNLKLMSPVIVRMFNTQLKLKGLKFLLAIKVNLGTNSWYWHEKQLNFLQTRKWPAKLTNHTVYSNWEIY